MKFKVSWQLLSGSVVNFFPLSFNFYKGHNEECSLTTFEQSFKSVFEKFAVNV